MAHWTLKLFRRNTRQSNRKVVETITGPIGQAIIAGVLGGLVVALLRRK